MDDNAIIAEFVVESREHLADIENEILAIEAGGANVDLELVNKVFRAIHSIKGAAGFFGFASVQELAHEAENVLNLVRNRQLVPTSPITDVLLRAADKLRVMIEDLENSKNADVSEHVAQLRAAAAGEAPAAPEAPVEPAVEATLDEVQTLVTEAVEETGAIEPVAEVAENGPLSTTNASHRCPERGESPAAAMPAMTSAPAETNIRVSVRVLDHLMNLAGELVLSRNQLLQAVAAKENGNLDSVSSRLNQVTSHIQEAIMQTRLQVVETVFNRFPRVVRDLSNTLGKQCELVVEGEDVELDKSIIEAIGDPLTHLIRNAVDHGLESPTDRIRAGKPAKGRILLKAFHQAGKVHIAVSDDGGGIDPTKLKNKAVSRGLISAEQARSMSNREAMRLIFRPGFSTAEKVTNVSGRGVGMDVVRTNIERLGGTVDVDSVVGTGTTISITLPLTLAILPSLIVRCGTRRFAIPQGSISELVRVKSADLAGRLHRVNGAEVFRLRGDIVPLIRLSEVLGLEAGGKALATTARRAVNIIVVDTGHLRYGLIVDGLHDSEEIVVKPLGRHLKSCSCFAGATILGDGQVALILDTAGIAASARLAASHVDEVRSEDTHASDGTREEHQTLLLFTNAPHEQFGIPMELISRLERIRTEAIVDVGGQEVLQYRGTTLPLLALERCVQAAPRPQSEHLFVVVFRVMQREVGLIVPELIDIRRVGMHVDGVTFREAGVIGSLVVEDKTTRLLDLYQLTSSAHPDWFEEHREIQIRQEKEKSKILLAEDSDFFRKQLTRFLEADGHEVVGCADGLIAWNTLCAGQQQFDLLVTDLEMPNMNGLELTAKVRGASAYARMPIVAVTSLASEEDIQRGKQAGVDEYLIKLDRERLLTVVSEQLQAAKSR